MTLLSFLSFLIAFNRTLWNWNNEPLALESFPVTLLIVPYGIETKNVPEEERNEQLF